MNDRVALNDLLLGFDRSSFERGSASFSMTFTVAPRGVIVRLFRSSSPHASLPTIAPVPAFPPRSIDSPCVTWASPRAPDLFTCARAGPSSRAVRRGTSGRGPQTCILDPRFKHNAYETHHRRRGRFPGGRIVSANSLRVERLLTWSVLGRRMALPLLAFTMTTAVFLPFARLGVDPHHDGVMLKPALDVFSGQRLFSDTWSHYGALSTYIQVFFLWAMGRTLLAVKVGTVLAYGLTASILSLAWRRFLPSSLVVLSLVVCLLLPNFIDHSSIHIMLPWSSVYAMVFQALGLLYLLKTIDGSSIYDPFLCGVSAALVTWCRMPVGVFHSAACAAVLALMLYSSCVRKRYAIASIGFLAGILLIHGLFFAHLWATGSITDWYLQNIRFPAIWAELASNSRSRTGLSWTIGIVKKSLLDLFAVENLPGSGGKRVLTWVITVLPLVAMIVLPHVRGLARQSNSADHHRTDAWLLVPLLIFSLIGATYMDDWTLSLWVLAVPVVIFACTVIWTIQYMWKPAQHSEIYGRLPVALACGFLSLASWMQYYPLADARHCFWALVPMIGPFAYFLLLSATADLPCHCRTADSRNALVRRPDHASGPGCPKSVLDDPRRVRPGGHGSPRS